ncbi:MAG: helix-turn-helix transcriptional regulator [Alphaproteobacteria bacterium]|nr:helix-turn-helix transcriptional regulator [Alphaproteobacteria bacterium]
MKHKIIWNAIERLAKDNNLSCSGLAKLSGLDATTFNKSKWYFPDGSPRWPSCSTISKIIAATNTSVEHFAEICAQEKQKLTAENAMGQ